MLALGQLWCCECVSVHISHFVFVFIAEWWIRFYSDVWTVEQTRHLQIIRFYGSVYSLCSCVLFLRAFCILLISLFFQVCVHTYSVCVCVCGAHKFPQFSVLTTFV